MTDSTCPVCDSVEVNYWDDLASWICTECSYAYDTTQKQSASLPTIDSVLESKHSEDTTPPDWTRDVSIRDASEGNLVEAISQAEQLARGLSLSDETMLRAVEIVTKAWESNFMHGRTIRHTAASAVYVASRETSSSVPPGSLASAAELDKRDIKNTYIQLKKELQIELDPPTHVEFVKFICSNLDLANSVEHDAARLLNRQGCIAGNPIGIAAAGVYEVTRPSGAVTLAQLASLVSLTKETVWRHSMALREG